MKVTMPKLIFGGKEFYMADRFKYKGVFYHYIIEDIYEEGLEVEDINGNVEVNFIYKCEDGGYKNVTDDVLFNELMAEASKRIMLNQSEYIKQDSE